MTRVLGVDWGERRIGLAISDERGKIATPAGFLVRRAGKRPPIAKLLQRAQELEATAVVFGLPLDGNGDDTPRAVEVRTVAEQVRRRSGLPVDLVDERFTTAAARRAVRELGGKPGERRGDVDALAATVLLQHALDRSR